MPRDQRYWHQAAYPNTLTLTLRGPPPRVSIPDRMQYPYQHPEPLRRPPVWSSFGPIIGEIHQSGSPPLTRVCLSLFAHLDSRLDADGRIDSTFARWTRLLCSLYIQF